MGQVLSRFISFLLLPVFTAYLSPKDYGVIAILGIMNLIVISVFSFGFGASTGLCYFEGNDPGRKEKTIWSSVLILAVSVCALGVVAFLFPGQISELLFKSPAHAGLVTISLLSAGMIILNTQLMLYLMFEKRAFLYVAISTSVTLLSLGLSVYTIVLLGRGVMGMIESILIANIIGLILVVIPVVQSLPFHLSGAIARELLRFGSPLIPAALFLFILLQANQYILQRFRGLEEVGVYVIGFNFGLVMNLLVSAFSSAWYPHFMSYMDRPGEARDTIRRVVTLYIIGAGIVSLFFYAAARPVIMMMTQPPFHEAYQVIGPAATAFFLCGLFTVLLPSVYFAKEVKYVSAIQGTAAMIAVILNLTMIPGFGMLGATGALVLGNLSLVAIQLAWNRHRRRTYLEISYEWKRILPFGVFYTVFAVLALWPRHLNLSQELIFSALLALCLLFLLYRSLTGGERQFLASILRQLRI